MEEEMQIKKEKRENGNEKEGKEKMRRNIRKKLKK